MAQSAAGPITIGKNAAVNGADEMLAAYGIREYRPDGGGIIVYHNEIPVLVTDSDKEVRAYYAGILQGIMLAA